MDQNVHYDFCPKCGALMRQGVCQSCEFTVHINGETVGQECDVPQYNIPQYNTVNTEKNSKTGLIIGLIVGGIVLMLIFVVAVVIALSISVKCIIETNEEINNSKQYYEDDTTSDEDFTAEDEDLDLPDMTIEMPNADGQTWDDIWDEPTEEEKIDLDGDGIGDLEYELGEEGLNADYYPLITDYIRYDLDYSVSFMEYSNADNSVKCIYPQLDGNKKSIAYINQFLYNFAEETEEIANDNECNAKSEAYVTYMDENLISIVFIEIYTKNDDINYEYIYCHTFDMSGEEFKLIEFEPVDTSDAFLDEVKTRCIEQSTSDAEYLFNVYSYDEIRSDILTEEYGLVAFYTPLGMEIGLNYNGYWCCATFKDYADYIRVATNEEKGIEF